MLTSELKIEIANIGENVGLALGTKMVKDYYDTYPDNASAYIIGKEIITKILAQPDCHGVILCNALDELGNKTFVYAGVDIDGKPITAYPLVTPNGTIRIEEGIVADRAGTSNVPHDPNLDW
jgi:hypothetical protein